MKTIRLLATFCSIFFTACGSNSSDVDGGTDAGEPWHPSVFHEDDNYTQEVSTTLGSLQDVTSLAVDGQGVIYAAGSFGVMSWDGSAWSQVQLPLQGKVFRIEFDSAGTIGAAGENGVVVGAQVVALPSGMQAGFISPRKAGGWWIAGDGFAGWWDEGNKEFNALDELAGKDVRCIVERETGTWFAATSEGVLGKGAAWTVSDGLVSDDVRTLAVAADGTMWAGTAQGLASLSGGADAWSAFTGADGLHYGDILWLRSFVPGDLLVATSMGASVYGADGGRRYYLGRKLLPSNEVRDLLRLADGRLLFATSSGVSRVEPVSMTLEDRASEYDRIVQQRHVRLIGFTSTQCPLSVPGDMTSYYQIDDDNDGQWTEMYLASQCFRYAVTGSEQARENAKTAAHAMIELLKVPGMGGFFARSIVPPEECGEKQASGAGEWHLSPDGKWCWKGDTSSDEFVGHVFGLSLFYDLVADEQDKQETAEAFGDMLGYIVDNGYQLMDVDGKPTTHGHFDPQWMEEDLGAMFGDAGLNSAMILGGLKAAYHMTGEQRFLDAFDELVNEHDYKDYVSRIEEINTAWHTNHDSEEMSFLAMFTLIRYEEDPDLLKQWLHGLDYLWEVQRPERNPEFNFMYAAMAKSDEYDLDMAIETLQKLPFDLVIWGVDNSHRLDLDIDPRPDRAGNIQNKFVLPYNEREIMRWSENPYRLVQPGGGRSESSGMFWLLPYWMGRYYGIIR